MENKLEEYKEIAKSRGGVCLSNKYSGAHHKLTFRCKTNHTWKAKATNIKTGTWCPECAGKVRSHKKKLLELKNIAATRNGKCLSKEYISSKHNMIWQCLNKHIWLASSSNITRGTWCPNCAGKNKSINDCKEYALSKNGQCLSKKILKWNELMLWKCSEDHVFKKSFNAIFQGKWCPYCSGLLGHSIEQLKELAISRGGILKSSDYYGQKYKYIWQCHLGHKWQAAASSIKNGTWCPRCSSYLGEEFVRVCIQKLTGHEFPKTKPLWLSKNSRRYELDGYCEKLMIGFEHHGRQHYESNTFYKNSSEELKERKKVDDWKIKKSKKEGVDVIVVWDVPGKTKYTDVIPYLISQLKKLNVTNLNENITVDLNSIFTHRHIVNYNKMNGIVISKGGLLDKKSFTGLKNRVNVTCKKGHTWNPIAEYLFNNWCPKCNNLKLTIADIALEFKSTSIKPAQRNYLGYTCKMKWRCPKGHIFIKSFKQMRQYPICSLCAENDGYLNLDCNSNFIRRSIQKSALAEKLKTFLAMKKGKLLDSAFPLRVRDKIEIQCRRGHIWKTSAMTLFYKNRWCQVCSGRTQHTIEELHLLAKKKGGQCLSKFYKTTATKYKWLCKYGHAFSAIATTVIKGHWCQKCHGRI